MKKQACQYRRCLQPTRTGGGRWATGTRLHQSTDADSDEASSQEMHDGNFRSPLASPRSGLAIAEELTEVLARSSPHSRFTLRTQPPCCALVRAECPAHNRLCPHHGRNARMSKSRLREPAAPSLVRPLSRSRCIRRCSSASMAPCLLRLPLQRRCPLHISPSPWRSNVSATNSSSCPPCRARAGELPPAACRWIADVSRPRLS